MNQEDTSEALFSQNVTSSSLSNILQEEHNQVEPNDVSEINTTGVDVEGNNNQVQNFVTPSNFIEKKNYEDNHLQNFQANGMKSQKHIDAVELCKYYDNYYLEALLNEFYNNENKVFALTKSRNYVPKEEVYFQGNLIEPYSMPSFLYYTIQIKDIIFCTYINKHYGLHRIYHKLAQNANNNTT